MLWKLKRFSEELQTKAQPELLLCRPLTTRRICKGPCYRRLVSPARRSPIHRLEDNSDNQGHGSPSFFITSCFLFFIARSEANCLEPSGAWARRGSYQVLDTLCPDRFRSLASSSPRIELRTFDTARAAQGRRQVFVTRSFVHFHLKFIAW